MQNIIDIYYTKNHYLALLKDIIKQYDGKTLGKRFNNFLDKFDINFSYNGFHSDFWASDIPNGSYGDKNFLTVYSSDLREFTSNNRINAEGLIKLIDEQLAHNTEQIKQMQKDQEQKEELISKYNSLVDEIEKLTKSMSYEFRNKYKNEFKTVIYKCGRWLSD